MRLIDPHLTVGGGPPVLYAPCKFLKLDGNNDVVKQVTTTTTRFIVDDSPFTISSYIRFDYYGGLVQVVFGSWDASGSRNLRLDVVNVDATTFKLRILTSNDGVNVGNNIETTNSFNYGEIHHIAFKMDIANLTMKLYVNGVEEAFASALTSNTIGGSYGLFCWGGHTSYFTDPSLYFGALYSNYKSDADMLAMYSIADGLPYEPATTSLVNVWDSNTVTWNTSKFDSADGGVETVATAEESLIECLIPSDLSPDFWWYGDIKSYNDAGITLCTEGQSIAQIGANVDTHIFSDTVNLPTWHDNIKNGHAVARFNGTNDSLSNTTIVSSSPQTNNPRTLAMVLDYGAGTGNPSPQTIQGSGNATWRPFRRVTADSELQLFKRSNSGSSFNIRHSNPIDANTWYVLIIVDTGTTCDMYVNGVKTLDGQTTNLGLPQTIVDNFIGKGATSAQYFGGDIAEVFQKEGTITENEALGLNAYLQDKYDIYG